MTNRLINETSPYLLQHAQNPVDWFPWGEEAFAKARAENKPLLVSIGYAACHWCHVMERESFEDPEIAAKMNELFVSIKVDREERPDVDSIYMQALVSMEGRGGWPLNVFLMPSGAPFYGGTYYPNEDRGRMLAWPRVLDAVADAYHNKRQMVEGNALTLTASLRSAAQTGAADEPISADVAHLAFRDLVRAFDSVHGGFGEAPKFPQSMPQEFLLRYHVRTGAPDAKAMVLHSLKKMAAGGIYDHLGGGFARYSTDERWLVPHFEKMLYDNALLALAYLQAYQLTSHARFRDVTVETLDYLLRDLLHPEGGLFSSQDADSEGVEGKFYIWTPDQLDTTLTKEDAAALKEIYALDKGPNFEGQNILHLANMDHPAGPDLAGARKRLRDERGKRVPPATDDKVLTAWNGLAIRALAEAGAVLEEARFTEAAERAAAFVLGTMRPEGRLLRTWKDGKAHLLGYLEDYALLINALVSLHAATFTHAWLHAARELTDEMLDLFWDNDAECLFDVGTDHEQLIIRPRETYDNAMPSGSSAATEALLRMGVIVGDARYTATAARLLRSMVPLLAKAPLAFGNWLKAMELYLAEPAEVVIVGTPDAADTRALLRALHASYDPNRVIVGVSPDEPAAFASPLFEGRGTRDGAAQAYVCSGYQCELPTTDADVFASQLGGASRSA